MIHAMVTENQLLSNTKICLKPVTKEMYVPSVPISSIAQILAISIDPMLVELAGRG